MLLSGADSTFSFLLPGPLGYRGLLIFFFSCRYFSIFLVAVTIIFKIDFDVVNKIHVIYYSCCTGDKQEECTSNNKSIGTTR